MTVRHSKALKYINSDLFSGLKSFRELEQRIEAIEGNKNRGDAFEVFVEAYIATQKIMQTVEVWPENTFPTSIRAKLNLPPIDMGVDGVYEHLSGDYVCYQAKFRTGRPSLSWKELSTFFGLAESTGPRLVVTNCDKIAKTATERSGAIFVRGIDLERLDTDNFRVIEAWISGVQIIKGRKDPWGHQQVAIDKIVSGLSINRRVTALMACGSGKTLVALWVAQALKPKTVLILLPSLALIRQILHEWVSQTSWERPEFMCVCSDQSIKGEIDTLQISASDVDFSVTTDSKIAHDFLARESDSVKLVFSTYQSSKVVAEAIKGLKPFDFGVFDEAHKTAGREGKKFGTALIDENIPIAKRLFMTATPRHYDVRSKDKFGDAKLVFSMDDTQIYGPIVHRLTFKAAAEEEIITNYKVIISVVTSEMVKELKRGQSIKIKVAFF